MEHSQAQDGRVISPGWRITTEGSSSEGGCTAARTVANSWPGGIQAEVTVTAGSSVAHLWSGVPSGTSTVTVSNTSWNNGRGATQSTIFGLVDSDSAPAQGPVTCTAGWLLPDRRDPCLPT